MRHEDDDMTSAVLLSLDIMAGNSHIARMRKGSRYSSNHMIIKWLIQSYGRTLKWFGDRMQGLEGKREPGEGEHSHNQS